MNPKSTATAVAHSNIALIKYWGKLQQHGNYPAVPSLSLTLDALSTQTQVTFDPDLAQDEIEIDGARPGGQPRQRVISLLDSIRSRAKLDHFAKVVSSNNFPTASGLASSASGFAALALAASHAARLSLEPAAVSSIARACSASAARSIFGGWVTLNAGAEYAKAIDSGQDWNVALVIAITDTGPKVVGSTQGMNRSSATSPCYPIWVELAPAFFARACDALHGRDLETLGQCMEESTWMMHATMLTAKPAVVYISPTTMLIVNEIRRRRSAATPAFFTTDAGPHVKVLTLAVHATTVRDWLLHLPGVNKVVICKPGPAACLLPDSLEGMVH